MASGGGGGERKNWQVWSIPLLVDMFLNDLYFWKLNV